jgi:hypothetical protein
MEVLLKQLGGKQGIKQPDAVVLPLQNVRCVCTWQGGKICFLWEAGFDGWRSPRQLMKSPSWSGLAG